MQEFPDTNHSLLERVQEIGDDTSWAEFLGIYQPVVVRMARSRGLQDADAHDAMQQVFISVARSIQKWETDPAKPPFRAWLTTIARNAITKALTRASSDRGDLGCGSTTMLDLMQQVPAVDRTEIELSIEARREAFRWAADQIRGEFSSDTWAAFWQTTIQGKSVGEFAKTSGKKPGSIYVARYRVLERLKEKVRELTESWSL